MKIVLGFIGALITMVLTFVCVGMALSYLYVVR